MGGKGEEKERGSRFKYGKRQERSRRRNKAWSGKSGLSWVLFKGKRGNVELSQGAQLSPCGNEARDL